MDLITTLRNTRRMARFVVLALLPALANAVKREALGLEPNPLFRTYACESAQGDI